MKKTSITTFALSVGLGLCAVSSPAASDFRTENEAFRKLIRDRKLPIATVSNAVDRVLATTNITPKDAYNTLREFANQHNHRKLSKEALATLERAAALKDISPDDKANALAEIAKSTARKNYTTYGTYDSSFLLQAAEMYRSILKIEGLSNKTRIAMRQALADALFNAKQEIDEEGVKLIKESVNLPGLTPEERWDAECALADFYNRIYDYTNAKAIYETLPAKALAFGNKSKARQAAHKIATLSSKTGVKPEVLAERLLTGDLRQYLDDGMVIHLCCEIGHGDKVEALAQKRFNDPKMARGARREIENIIRPNNNAITFAAYKAKFDKFMLPYLKTHGDEFADVLNNILNSRNWHFATVASDPAFNDWILAMNDLAPEGKKLPADKLFDLTYDSKDLAKAKKYAAEIIKMEKPNAAKLEKAKLFLALADKFDNPKGAVKSVAKYIKGLENADAKKVANTYLDATKIALVFAREEVVRALYGEYVSHIVRLAQNETTCAFIKGAPQNIADILRSPFYNSKAKKAQLDRKYGNNLQFVLETDAAMTGRNVSHSAISARYPDLFTFCDEEGVKLIINVYVDKMEIEKFKAGFGNLPSYEAYIAAGIDQPYNAFLFNPPATKLDMGFLTQYDNGTGYRNLDTDKNNFILSHYVGNDSIATMLSLSWKAFFERIPQNGDKWYFEPLVWTQGGLSWGGSESVHNRSSFGTLVFADMTDENRTLIKRRLLPVAKQIYTRAKSARSNGEVEIWQDNELGDRVFYKEVLAPVIAELDTYADRIKFDMSDEDVNDIFDNAASRMFNIKYIVSALRTDYLDAKRVRGE